MYRFFGLLLLAALWPYSAHGQPEAAPGPFQQLPAMVQPPKENLTSFEYRQLSLSSRDGRWELHVGTTVLKDFGKRDAEAREALRIIRALRLNQLGTVGSPQPIIEYWLSDGKPPSGWAPGLRTVSFNLAELRVERLQGHWCVRDNRLVLANFGSHEKEARQAEAILRHHGFNRVGFVGQPQPLMMYFVSDRDLRSARPDRIKPTNGLIAGQQQLLPRTRPGAGRIVLGEKAGRTPGQDFRADEFLPFAKQLHQPPAPSSLDQHQEERVPFDWRHVQLRLENKSWKLLAGKYTLADFGQNDRDARLALKVVQHYRFSEHCHLGTEPSRFHYFLVNGQAPRGLAFGVRYIRFRHDLLTLRRSGEDWSLAEGDRTVLTFGNSADLGRQVLDIIRTNRFDHLCWVGSPDPSGLVFLVQSK